MTQANILILSHRSFGVNILNFDTGNLFLEMPKAILNESLFVECLVILSIGKNSILSIIIVV